MTAAALWREPNRLFGARGYMTDTRLSFAAAAASVWRSSTKEQLRSNRILIKHSYVLGKQREERGGRREAGGERREGDREIERGEGPCTCCQIYSMQYMY